MDLDKTQALQGAIENAHLAIKYVSHNNILVYDEETNISATNAVNHIA